VVNHTTAMIQHNLEIDDSRISGNGNSVAKQLGNLEPILTDMFTAQQDQDWILLADLIEYELIPHFNDRQKILTSWKIDSGE
jgi:hypothetical protein